MLELIAEVKKEKFIVYYKDLNGYTRYIINPIRTSNKTIFTSLLKEEARVFYDFDEALSYKNKLKFGNPTIKKI